MKKGKANEERKRQEGKLQLPPPLIVSKQSPLDLFLAPFFFGQLCKCLFLAVLLLMSKSDVFSKVCSVSKTLVDNYSPNPLRQVSLLPSAAGLMNSDC